MRSGVDEIKQAWQKYHDLWEAKRKSIMRSGVDDLLIVLEWLGVSKTMPPNVEAAMERLQKRASRNVPIDVKMYDNGQDEAEAKDEYIGRGVHEFPEGSR